MIALLRRLLQAWRGKPVEDERVRSFNYGPGRR